MGVHHRPAIFGTRKRPLISLDEALRPAGRLEVTTHLRRLIHGAERTSESPVINSLFAEIDALHHPRLRDEQTWILALQRPVGSLRISLGFLRGDLNQIAATIRTAIGIEDVASGRVADPAARVRGWFRVYRC